MKPSPVLIVLCLALGPLLHAQNATVKADPWPDESMSQAYMALDRDCRISVNKRADPTEAIAACKKVAEEADGFNPQSHFITRRAAYVFYTLAPIQGKKTEDAVAAGDKAVAVVSLGHDDGSGSSAAYRVRGQARALAGDFTGADQDLEKAESYERNALSGPAGQALNAEYTRVLKGLLNFHAQILAAMGREAAASAKLDQASKLSSEEKRM
jgi:tetratricopeptide (TPR) repeat protein